MSRNQIDLLRFLFSSNILKCPKESDMAYKLDGAKFPTLEELIAALYPLYAEKMSEADFKKYVQENAKQE